MTPKLKILARITKHKSKTVSEENSVVVNAEIGPKGYTTKMSARRHKALSDEPIPLGGEDIGPTPKEYMCMALASCILITLRMYAERKDWDIGSVNIEIRHYRQENDEGDLIDYFEKHLAFSQSLDDKQIKRLVAISDKCPVSKLLAHGAKMRTHLV